MRKVNVICKKDYYGEHRKDIPALKKDESYLVHTDDKGFINFFDKDNVSQLVMFGWKLDEINDIVEPINKHIKSFNNFKK
jgi:hypothetical protein